jgi:hypothetical protein
MVAMSINRQKRDERMAKAVLQRGATIKQTAEKNGLCISHVANVLHAYCKQHNLSKYNEGRRSSKKKDWSKCDGGWLWMKWLKVDRLPAHWDKKDLRPTLFFLRAYSAYFCRPPGKKSP